MPGFQHALIGYARNVRGLAEADHAEWNLSATVHVIAPLSCSLVGAKGAIKLKEGSRLRSIYGKAEAIEEYPCNFGFTPPYLRLLKGGILKW